MRIAIKDKLQAKLCSTYLQLYPATIAIANCNTVTLSMAKFGLVLVLFIIAKASVFTVTDAQSCNACNCQFDNVQALSRLVQAEVNRVIAGEPRKLILIIAIYACLIQ